MTSLLAAVARSSARGHGPAFLVVDSTGEGLSLASCNPNANEEVARWFQALPHPLADKAPR
ncbi:MAG: hypothetical protein FWF02_07320 [Micrococcales bacterium]|nr:hypothetical protein [Micrococcales bacterium]MCL2667502.1 hypothetical protein [Micrococcales bacterium]